MERFTHFCLASRNSAFEQFYSKPAVTDRIGKITLSRRYLRFTQTPAQCKVSFIVFGLREYNLRRRKDKVKEKKKVGNPIRGYYQSNGCPNKIITTIPFVSVLMYESHRFLPGINPSQRDQIGTQGYWLK